MFLMRCASCKFIEVREGAKFCCLCGKSLYKVERTLNLEHIRSMRSGEELLSLLTEQEQLRVERLLGEHLRGECNCDKSTDIGLNETHCDVGRWAEGCIDTEELVELVRMDYVTL